MIVQQATSLQYVPIIVTAMNANPTGDSVAIAFTAPGADPQPSDWNAAGWDASADVGVNQYLARCLVGPGGAVQLAVGAYQVWIKITDNPEVPVLPAGYLTIY